MAFDYGGMLLPFQIAFLLLVFTTIFAALFLPYIDPTPPLTSPSTTQTDPKKKKQSLLTPLKIFIPKRKLVDGKGRWDFNLFFLASGAFFSVLATGYVGMGLQLVATNVFGFKPGDSGLMLVSLSRCDITLGLVWDLVGMSKMPDEGVQSRWQGHERMELISVIEPIDEGILPLHPLPPNHSIR
jgi:hypothetical protein